MSAFLPPSFLAGRDADALCAETDPDAFFPDPGGEGIVVARQAKGICARCELRAPCLQWALDNGEAGIWGGLTEQERRRLRARMERTAARQRTQTPEGVEVRVLELTAKGWTADDIAREFDLSTRTVKRIRERAREGSAA